MCWAMPDAQIPPALYASRIEVIDTGCWMWTGARTQGKRRPSYGVVKLPTGRTGAHRAVYAEVMGPIPKGLELDHLCRVPLCVNPAHLEPVTHRENILRGKTVPARNAAKTHCPQGHEYTPENTYVNPIEGYRQCRTCIREAKETAHAR